MKIRDVMVSPVATCEVGTDLAAAAMIMWREDCGVIPVVDPKTRKAIGIITDRDICMATATRHRPAHELSVGEVISRQVYGCKPEDGVRAALEMMRHRRVRRLPVVDSDGTLCGIVSMNDLVLRAEPARGRQQPEISCEEVVTALQGICAHPGTAARVAEPAHALA